MKTNNHHHDIETAAFIPFYFILLIDQLPRDKTCIISIFVCYVKSNALYVTVSNVVSNDVIKTETVQRQMTTKLSSFTLMCENG